MDSLNKSNQTQRNIVATIPIAELTENTTRSFTFPWKGKVSQGFIVCKEGKYFAYRNRCCHLPFPLDLDDGNFLNKDRTHLLCQRHGALYEIETGKCIAGPCIGASLHSFLIQQEKENLLIQL